MMPKHAALLDFLAGYADDSGYVDNIDRAEALRAWGGCRSGMETALSGLVTAGHVVRLDGRAASGTLGRLRLTSLGVSAFVAPRPVATKPAPDPAEVIAAGLRKRFGIGIATIHRTERSTSGETRHVPISLARIPWWFEGERA